MELFCTIETFFVPQSDSIAHFMFQGSHTCQEGLKQVRILSYWARDSKDLCLRSQRRGPAGMRVPSRAPCLAAPCRACALSRGPVQGNTQAGPMPGAKGPGLHKRQKAPAANRASSSGGMFKAAALRAAKVGVAADKQASSTTGSATPGDARGRTGGKAANCAGQKRTRSSSEELSSDGSQAVGAMHKSR